MRKRTLELGGFVLCKTGNWSRSVVAQCVDACFVNDSAFIGNRNEVAAAVYRADERGSLTASPGQPALTRNMKQRIKKNTHLNDWR